MLVTAIHFPEGTCEEAIAFYQKVFSATVLSVVHEHEAPPDSGIGVAATGKTRNNVIHSELIISGTRINMADGAPDIIPGNMYLFNVFLDSADEVKTVFNQLAEGGKVVANLGPQFWTSLYGEVEDRFGLRWQIMTNS